MHEPILVLGAGGKLGREVVRQLLASGYTPRCATRNPERNLGTAPDVAWVRFDWRNPQTWRPALDGVQRVFLTARPLDISAAAILPGFIDLCCDLEPEHVVFSSSFGTDAQPAAPLGLVESYLRHSGLAWTILRPNFFMENFSHGWLLPDIDSHGSIRLAASDGRTSFISVRDVAAVAVAAFADPAHRGQAYDLTGDDALSHTAVAAALTRASGRPVNYEAVDEAAMREVGRRAGLPGGRLEYLLALYNMVRQGNAERRTSTVVDLLGRAPVSFDEFARHNAGAWRVMEGQARA